MIEEKLDYLSEKVDQVHQAVEDLDCGGDGSGSDDTGMKIPLKIFEYFTIFFSVILIAGGYSDDYGYLSSVELYNPKTSFSCYLPSLPAWRVAPVSSGLLVCGGYEPDCVEFSGGAWSTADQLNDDRVGSSGWESSQGFVIMGGTSDPSSAVILREGYSEELFTLSPGRQ